jgi:hypothetical protein
LSDYIEVMTPHGPFQFRNTESKKPNAPAFATDAFSCGVGCPMVSMCYARTIQLRYPAVNKRWRLNQAVLDSFEAEEDFGGLVELFAQGYAWAEEWGETHFRGWVGGAGTEFQIKALSEAATLPTWVPSESFGQETVGRRSLVVVRSSTGKGPFKSKTFDPKKKPPRGALVCSETCGKCRACWDKSVPLVAYRWRPGTSPGSVTKWLRRKEAQ